MPNAIAYQDLGALVSQPSLAERARDSLIASPFGTIHAATFSMPRPIGTAIPHPPLYALANYDPADITGSIGSQPLGDGGPLRFPKVNRQTKTDSDISRAREPLPPMPPLLAIEPVTPSEAMAEAKSESKSEAETRFDPYAQYEFPGAPEEQVPVAESEPSGTDLPPATIAAAPSGPDESKTRLPKDNGRIFFGTDPLVDGRPAIAPWAPGEAPKVVSTHTGVDPDIKLSALAPSKPDDELKGGESIASKGEVTGAGARPHSPAERLALAGAARAKAEKCLANAVYFESRGEPVRGQIAVAQVVMNRVFSPFYPKTVCEVVYQNAHRHNSCQFTFACDGIPDVVTEPDAWLRAQRIARDMLDGKLWMPEVAKSTHYHAYWVHPSWVGEMKKMYALGVHKFYRPLNWGDGSDEPHWGDAATTEAAAKHL